MKKLLFLFIIPCFAFSQDLSLIEQVEVDADVFIGIDNYNHTYFIKNQALYKSTDSENFYFQDFQLGIIFSVDIINPLKIVVYYADFNTVIILDNTLNEIERINFNEIEGFENIQTATLATNNSLWIFNTNTQQLELYNYRFKRNTIVSQPIEGTVLFQNSNFNYCLLVTEDTIRKYNIYGSLINETENNGVSKIYPYKDTFITLNDSVLYFFSEKGSEELVIPTELSKNTIKELHIIHDFLYIYDGKFLYKFRLNLTN